MNEGPREPGQPPHDRAAERVAAYGKVLGQPTVWSRDVSGGDLRVDVYGIPPGWHGRDFHTLVTSGLSDRAMPVPEDLGAEHARAELVLYASDLVPEHVALLRRTARLVEQPDAWLGHGHTIPNGMPPAPLFPGSALAAVLLLRTVLEPDAFLGDELRVDGQAVNLLWLMPITRGELELKLDRGLEALLQRFDEAGLPHVLDETRTCVVG